MSDSKSNAFAINPKTRVRMMWPPPERGNNHQSLFRKNLLNIGNSNHLHKLCKVYHNQRDQLQPPRLPSSVNVTTHCIHWFLQHCPAHPQWMLLLSRYFGMSGWSFLLSIHCTDSFVCSDKHFCISTQCVQLSAGYLLIGRLSVV